jgi:alkylated DNA repair dioxygenase AlkB
VKPPKYDLFAAGSDPLQLPLPGAEVCLFPQVDLGVDVDELLHELLRQTPWQTGDIVLFGKRHQQPRLFAWYGDAQAHYAYSGTQLAPRAWTPRLQGLRECMEALAGVPFNSVLLNCYRDERDSMGLHADDEPELGLRPVIASLSLGAERVFRFRHRHDRTLKPLRLPLPAGSVLLMAGDTQRNWKHELPRQSRPCGPRVNLTFRLVQPRP